MYFLTCNPGNTQQMDACVEGLLSERIWAAVENSLTLPAGFTLLLGGKFLQFVNQLKAV